MKFGAASIRVEDLGRQVGDLCQQAESQLAGERADLAMVFITSHFEEEAEPVVQALVRRYPTAAIAGISAEGVIGPGIELERIPAAAILLASLPDCNLKPFRISAETLASATPESWPREIGVSDGDRPTFLFFGDPFTVPVNPVLNLFNRAYPERPVFGGMASGCERPGQAVLILDDQIYRDGAVGIALSGPIEVHSAVSQGCRPIGRHFVITKAQQNIILELGGKPALQQLRQVVSGLSPDEVRLARQALFVGRAINEYKDAFGCGDFLIRNLVGIDPTSGAIAVGEEMRVGATVQFHVRDGASADEDLRRMLASGTEADAPIGALLFSCNGRGTRMWNEPNHDVGVLREQCGSIPVAGFFAAGEIGPIGGKNFIHGHTASIALFHPVGKADK